MTKIRIQVLALVALSSTLTYAQQDNKKGYLTGALKRIRFTTRMIVRQKQNLRKIISVRTII